MNTKTLYSGQELFAFPDSLEYIDEEAFQHKQIRHIYFPDSIKFIGKAAFRMYSHNNNYTK